MSSDKNKAKNKSANSSPSDIEASDAQVKVVDVEDGIQGDTQEQQATHQSVSQSAAQNFDNNDDGPADTKEKIELNFTGSEMLRAKFPKPFDLLETVATDWVNDGKFEGLPLGHPLAQYFAAKGLRKAKEVEKKVLESPVTEKVAMQAFTVGMKATAIIQEVRAKIKNK